MRRVKKIFDLEEEDVDNGVDGFSNVFKILFVCFEEECIKLYKRYFFFLKYMECGRYKFFFECEMFYDCVMLGYVLRLEYGMIVVFELGKVEFFLNFLVLFFLMGWVLKCFCIWSIWFIVK